MWLGTIFSSSILLASLVTFPQFLTGNIDVNRFSLKIFEKIVLNRTSENVVFSPYSIESLLTLLLLGSRGETAAELCAALSFGSCLAEKILFQFKDLTATLSESGSATINTINRIYVDSDISIQPSFEEIAKAYFNADAETINFRNTESAANEISDWVASQTNDKIKNILQPQDLATGDTLSVLVSAIYFKAQWQNQFDPHQTRQLPFHLDSNSYIYVDTLKTTASFITGYQSSLRATAIFLPYLDSNFQMLILLPLDADGLKDLEEKAIQPGFWLNSEELRKQQIELYIPKFKINFKTNLQEHLEQLGIKKIFQNADLGQLLVNQPPKFSVSCVKQSAVIEVDEAGTEAAASTVVIASTRSSKPTIRVDRPFVYFILSDEVMLFAGHVADPSLIS